MNDAADTFQRLSQVLTGEVDLESRLVPGLIERVRLEPEGAHLDRLLDLFDEILASGVVEGQIKSRIMSDPDLQPLAVTIVLLWYLGDLRRPRAGNPPTEEQYFGAILWRVVRAHPPALSGGYFGQWTYPPD